MQITLQRIAQVTDATINHIALSSVVSTRPTLRSIMDSLYELELRETDRHPGFRRATPILHHGLQSIKWTRLPCCDGRDVVVQDVARRASNLVPEPRKESFTQNVLSPCLLAEKWQVQVPQLLWFLDGRLEAEYNNCAMETEKGDNDSTGSGEDEPLHRKILRTLTAVFSCIIMAVLWVVVIIQHFKSL